MVLVIADGVLRKDSGNTYNMFRIVLMMPGLIAFFMLAQSGGHMVGFEDGTVGGVLDNMIVTHTETPLIIYEEITFSTNATSNIPQKVSDVTILAVQAPVPEVWGYWHLMLGMILFVFIFRDALGLLFLRNRGK